MEGSELCGSEPEVPVEVRGYFGWFGGGLAAICATAVVPDVDFFDLADGAIADEFDGSSEGVTGGSLVSHGGCDAELTGKEAEGA